MSGVFPSESSRWIFLFLFFLILSTILFCSIIRLCQAQGNFSTSSFVKELCTLTTAFGFSFKRPAELLNHPKTVIKFIKLIIPQLLFLAFSFQAWCWHQKQTNKKIRKWNVALEFIYKHAYVLSITSYIPILAYNQSKLSCLANIKWLSMQNENLVKHTWFI